MLQTGDLYLPMSLAPQLSHSGLVALSPLPGKEWDPGPSLNLNKPIPQNTASAH